MAPTYYQIDLSGRTLIGLVVALALLLVLAFALGYGAAWTTLRPADVIAAPTFMPTRTPTPIPEVVVAPPDLVLPSPTLAPPVSTPTLAAPATATPGPPLATPTPQPRRPSPTPVAEPVGYWVQVIAVSHADAVADARGRLERLGFGGDRQRVLESPVAGGKHAVQGACWTVPGPRVRGPGRGPDAGGGVQRLLGGDTVSFGGQIPTGAALPEWIRGRKLRLGELHEIKRTMRRGGLHTVCEEARCPNRSECFGHGTATFLINGRVCTRSCSYCSIAHGRPAALDPAEPRELVEAVVAMGLRHVVITAVDRDDLPDGGASGFVACIEGLRALDGVPTIEVLTPDFRGDMTAVDRIVAAGPDVYNHNVETVPRLYRQVRRSGRYRWAMDVLERVAERAPGMLRKSGIMVGLGESRDEVLEVLGDLASAGCQVVTIGQYLRPTPEQVEVVRYWRPEEFDELEAEGRARGLEVFAGPFVRSSYRAEEAFLRATGPSRLPVVNG